MPHTTTSSKPQTMLRALHSSLLRGRVQLICTQPQRLVSACAQAYATEAPYDDAVYTSQQTPDLLTVDYEPDMGNFATLAGNLGADPEFREFPSGRCVANMRLAVGRGPETARVTDWYDVEAWDALARQCHQKLQRGSWIVAQGRLKVVTWTQPDTQTARSKVRLVANLVNKLRSAANSAQPDAAVPGQSYAYETDIVAPAAPAFGVPRSKPLSPDERAQLWRTYEERPEEFWDNRHNKRNPRAPDFKHKTTGDGLWMDNAPPELRERLLAEEGAPY